MKGNMDDISPQTSDNEEEESDKSLFERMVRQTKENVALLLFEN